MRYAVVFLKTNIFHSISQLKQFRLGTIYLGVHMMFFNIIKNNKFNNKYNFIKYFTLKSVAKSYERKTISTFSFFCLFE